MLKLSDCRAGPLKQLSSDEVKEAFRQPADADAIEALADAYVDGIRSGTFKEQGFSQSMYGMSKVAEMSYTRWLAGALKQKVLAASWRDAAESTGHAVGRESVALMEACCLVRSVAHTTTADAYWHCVWDRQAMLCGGGPV